MTLREWLRQNPYPVRLKMANKVGTTVAYLYKLAGGHGRPGWSICPRIEQATQGQVTRHELRPDIYPEENMEEETDASV